MKILVLFIHNNIEQKNVMLIEFVNIDINIFRKC